MKYYPDYNLFMELASRYPIGVINDFLVKYQIVGNSLSRKSGYCIVKNSFSLDRLLALNPRLKHTFYKNIENAYVRLHYYDAAVAVIYSNDREQARNQLLKVVFKRLPYLALYLLLWMPVSNNFILSLIRR